MAVMQTKAQRETAIRYIVFTLMLALMLNIWARDGIKSFYSFTTPIVLLTQGKTINGKVIDCARDYEYSSGGGRGYRSKIRGKALLAKSSSGELATGSYLPESIKKGWCDNQQGKQVTMLIHPSDASQNRISSFTQLWYLPFQLFLAFFWVAIASRVRVIFWVTLFLNAVIIPISLLNIV